MNEHVLAAVVAGDEAEALGVVEPLDRAAERHRSRRVRRDATISIAGTLWEVPPACRGRVVDVHYDPFLWKRVELYVEGRKVGDARRCDKRLNAHTF